MRILVLLYIICSIIILYGVNFINNLIKSYGVPFVKTDDDFITLLMGNIDLKPGQTFLDLGCGDAKILDRVSKKFPNAKLRGYEINDKTYKLALKNKEKNSGNYEIQKKDFFKEDISDANIIYCYLIQYLMGKVRKKIRTDCKKGTIIITKSFTFPNIKAEKILKDKNNQKLNIYKL